MRTLPFHTVQVMHHHLEAGCRFLTGWVMPYSNPEHRGIRFARAAVFVLDLTEGTTRAAHPFADVKWDYRDFLRVSADGAVSVVPVRGGVRVFRASDGEPRDYALAPASEQAPSLHDLALDPAGRWLVARVRDRRGQVLRSVDLHSGEIRTLTPVKEPVQWSADAVKWSPDGTRVLALSEGYLLVLAPDGSTRRELWREAEFWDAAWLDAETVAALAQDGVHLADVAKFRWLRHHPLEGLASGAFPQLGTSAADGRLFVYAWGWATPSGRKDPCGVVCLERPRDAAPGERRFKLRVPRRLANAQPFPPWDAATASVVFAPCEDGVVRSLRLDSELVERARVSLPMVEGLSVSADGAVVAARAGYGVEIWRCGERVASLRERGAVGAVLVSPDGQRIFVAAGKSLRLLDATPEGKGVVFKGHSKPILALAYAPRHELVASAGEDCRVLVFSPDGAEVHRLEGHHEAVVSLDFDPAGARLASLSRDGAVRLWDVGSGVGVRDWRVDPAPSEVRWAVGGELAVLREQGVEMWDPDTGRAGRHVGPKARVTGLARHPERDEWALGDEAGQVWVADAAGDLRSVSRDHVGAVTALAWSNRELFVGCGLRSRPDAAIVAL